MRVILVAPASILAQCPACHRAAEVNGPHAYRLNGCWLIGRQSDDLNEWRERIKCLLSSPFIPLSCLAFISLRGEGPVCWEEVGPSELVLETSGDVIIIDM